VPTIGFDAMTTPMRSDFGLGKYVPQVGDAIQMHLTIQAAEAKSYADYLKAEAAKH
jgi:polyisoprenoid-binding protein YceI